MGTPAVPIVDLKPSDKIAGRFIVKKKLGEGACGQVYLVEERDPSGRVTRTSAMKVEPRMKHKDDEILKMEIFILKRLMNKSRHVCKFVGCGVTPQFTYLAMSLLGTELGDLKKKCPAKKFSQLTAVRLSIQAFVGLQNLHQSGFVHRDIKPANLAMGVENHDKILFIFDFGLARQFLMADGKGKLKLRDERPRVMFRGTVRYCSLNVHNFKEQGRHDDLIAYMHSIIECVTTLPWRGHVRKEAAKIKEKTTDEELCKGCPPSFLGIMKTLKKLKYKDVPPYALMIAQMKKDTPASLNLVTLPYEWTGKKVMPVKSTESIKGAKNSLRMREKSTDRGQKTTDRGQKTTEMGQKSAKERAEKDKGTTDDQKTIQDFDETVVTECDGESQAGADEGEFPANDDTLNGI